MYLPAAQGVQAKAFPAEYLPKVQGVQAAAPSAENVSTGQTEQAAALVRAGNAEYLPAAHFVQAAAPSNEYVPGMHTSTQPEAPSAEYLPASQLMHSVFTPLLAQYVLHSVLEMMPSWLVSTSLNVALLPELLPPHAQQA